MIEILLLLIIMLLIVNLFFVFRFRINAKEEDNLEKISKQIGDLDMNQERLRREVDVKLENIHRAGQSQFREAREIISDISLRSDRLINSVSEKLNSLDKTNQKIADFSSQIRDLQDILRNPKQRGILGEYLLEQVLSNALPPSIFSMQYSFSDGSKVDAVIFLKDKILPIDSKFSLSNYEKILSSKDDRERVVLQREFLRDLKRRIDETSKYIKPDESTTDFAFMFIPSETIYYDLLDGVVGSLKNLSIIEYALKERKVIIVSPTTFLAYLQTVLQGLKSLEIEGNAKLIKKHVEKLSKHWYSFDVYMQKISKTLTVLVNHFNDAYLEFSKIDKDVMKITNRKEKNIINDIVDKPINLR